MELFLWKNCGEISHISNREDKSDGTAGIVMRNGAAAREGQGSLLVKQQYIQGL